MFGFDTTHNTWINTSNIEKQLQSYYNHGRVWKFSSRIQKKNIINLEISNENLETRLNTLNNAVVAHENNMKTKSNMTQDVDLYVL